MNYQRLIAATKEQLLQCKDNLIKILYFPHCKLAFQRGRVTFISLAQCRLVYGWWTEMWPVLDMEVFSFLWSRLYTSLWSHQHIIKMGRGAQKNVHVLKEAASGGIKLEVLMNRMNWKLNSPLKSGRSLTVTNIEKKQSSKMKAIWNINSVKMRPRWQSPVVIWIGYTPFGQLDLTMLCGN